MRIRNQAKLAGITISNVGFSGDHSTAPIGTKCQLNQSPWHCLDSPLSSFQIGEQGDYNLDVSFWDSVEPVKSVPPMKISGNGDSTFSNKCSKKDAISADNKRIKLCAKTDGKSWKCKGEVAEGQTLCQHHLDQLKGYNTPTRALVSSDENSQATMGSTRRKKRVAPSSDPYYYYAGFGRHLGKQRGSTGAELDAMDHDYIEDSDSDEDGNVSGNKKARKPVKERSLKSLM